MSGRKTNDTLLCQGDQYMGLFENGVIIESYYDDRGCEVIKETFVEFDLLKITNIDSSDCFESLLLLQYHDGIKETKFTNINGCDSIVIINFEAIPTITIKLIENICEGSIIDQNFPNRTRIDTLKNVYGCDSILETKFVTISNYFVQIDTFLCAGDQYFDYNQSGNYFEYYSSINGCDSIIERNIKFIPLENGSCIASIYLNPSPNIFFIQSNTHNESLVIINVYDQNGYKIVSKNSTSSLIELNLSDFISGLYFVEIQFEGYRSVQKILKLN